MALTLQQDQGPLDRALGAAVLSAIPPTWSSCVLHADETRDAAGATISISLGSPGSEGLGLVTAALTDAVRALFRLYDRHGHSLRAIEYVYSRQADGRWAFQGNYTYR